MEQYDSVSELYLTLFGGREPIFTATAKTFIHTIMETKEFQVKIELSIGQTVYVRRHRPRHGKYEIVKFDGEDRVWVRPLFKTDTSMLNTLAGNIIPL